MKNSQNASGNNIANQKRARFEFKQLLNHYLGIKDPKELTLILPEATRYGKISQDLIPFFLGRIAIDTGYEHKSLWGLETIYNLLKNKKAVEELKGSCNFGYLDFIKLTGEADPFGFSKFSAVQSKDTPETVVLRSHVARSQREREPRFVQRRK